ncbi:MAG TPA: hypothetical protein VFP37_01295 [Steroidobacteraceae bacterium]|nr:hypothetical protein [Steroidobacteraceae bacterium]
MSASADVHSRRAAGESGALAVRGADAAKFLQGQLSADVEKLAPGGHALAGLHNPQGRVIAILGLARTSEDEFLATLPRELLAPVAQRLRKFVLRAKVRVEEVVSDRENASALPVSDTTGAAIEAVRAGLPQVYAATSEQFVAQMLNLDLVGAISFDKGCYTGQEVIARAHYRGRVKRRMQRWLNAGGSRLRPGDAARARDGRALAVVRVADLDDGRQELLAVGTFGPVNEQEAPATADGTIVDGPLPLPYSLPE